MEMMVLLKTHITAILVVATALQVGGTLILSLFSFFGVRIAASPNVFVNNKPVTHVEFAASWLNRAKAGLILLLGGILLSGAASIATAA